MFSLDGNICLELLEVKQPDFTTVFPSSKTCEGQKVPRSSTPGVCSLSCRVAISASPPQPAGTPMPPCGHNFAEGDGAEEHIGSVSLIPAGSQLPELHKGPFHALHKQARGMKGCYRRASARAAAQAGILKITSSQKHTDMHTPFSVLLGFME